jgi:hypothetical protein
MQIEGVFNLTGACPATPALEARSLLPAGPEPSMVQGRQEGAQYERNFICSYSARHCMPGKPRPVGGWLQILNLKSDLYAFAS